MEWQRMDYRITGLPRRARNRHAGFTLIEVVIALAVLGAGVLAVAGVFVQGELTSHSQTDLTQGVVVCQSKMEQLRTLSFGDTASDTTQTGPPYPQTGTGLTPGGSVTQSITGYSDQVDNTGAEAGGSTGLVPVYNRWWMITENPADTLKTIFVSCTDVSPRGPVQTNVELANEVTCSKNSYGPSVPCE